MITRTKSSIENELIKSGKLTPDFMQYMGFISKDKLEIALRDRVIENELDKYLFVYAKNIEKEKLELVSNYKVNYGFYEYAEKHSLEFLEWGAKNNANYHYYRYGQGLSPEKRDSLVESNANLYSFKYGIYFPLYLLEKAQRMNAPKEFHIYGKDMNEKSLYFGLFIKAPPEYYKYGKIINDLDKELLQILAIKKMPGRIYEIAKELKHDQIEWFKQELIINRKMFL